MLVTDDGKLEVGKTVDDVATGCTVTSVEAVEPRGSVSLEVAAAVDGADAELTVASLVGTVVVGTPAAEVGISAEVVIAPGSVVPEVKLLDPLATGAVLTEEEDRVEFADVGAIFV